MIIKGQARGRSSQLAIHLLRQDQNEEISIRELRGVSARDLTGALAEMEALAAAVHSKRPLYHASISPEAHRPLSEEQVRIAADTLERKLGLSGQPRAIVVHRKKDREHVHVVWSRVDLQHQRIISNAWNYRAHEEAARELEAAFGHRIIAGAHVPAAAPRRAGAKKDYEYRQSERSGRPSDDISAELRLLWQGSGNGRAFQKKLEQAGYALAKGDRRVFVVVDRAGNAHSLTRRLGIPTASLRTRLRDLDADALPSVHDVRAGACSRGDRGPLVARYRAAAREATRPAPRPPRRAARPAALLISFLAAISWINLPGHQAQPIARFTPVRFVTLARIRALRAAVLGDFARKMDAAALQLSDEALLAALARLADERDAALKALRRVSTRDREQPVRMQRQRRPRRRYAARRIVVRRGGRGMR